MVLVSPSEAGWFAQLAAAVAALVVAETVVEAPLVSDQNQGHQPVAVVVG